MRAVNWLERSKLKPISYSRLDSARGGMARLVDVAKAAGVSRATVSNVYNNPEKVRPEVRERVHQAARALGFAGPDPKARVLMGGKVHAIGGMTVGVRP